MYQAADCRETAFYGSRLDGNRVCSGNVLSQDTVVFVLFVDLAHDFSERCFVVGKDHSKSKLSPRKESVDYDGSMLSL